jgi:CDP-paratose 2-epimerase
MFQADGSYDAIVHCAAQTAHSGELVTDFDINVMGTMNLLKLWRERCPEAKFIYLSTIKVYGDAPCRIKYAKSGDRFTPDDAKTEWYDPERGFNEKTPIGQGVSSFFGRSKTASDLYTQEFRYQYGMDSYVLRPTCITGTRQLGTEAHGFLGYLMKCAYLKKPYTIYGYNGYQVRDQIYAEDIAYMIANILRWPKREHGPFVFNAGLGLRASCSVLEAVALCEKLTGNRMEIHQGPTRKGDHPWWVTDDTLYCQHDPSFRGNTWGTSVEVILGDILECNRVRWNREVNA